MSVNRNVRPPREQPMDPTRPTASTLDATGTREQQMTSTDVHRDGARRRAYIVGCLVAAVAATVGGVALLTGGGNKPDAAPTVPPAPVASRPTTAPPVSSPPIPADIAAGQAKARYLQFLQVRSRIAGAGYANLRLYDSVAISPARSLLTAEGRRLAGRRVTGQTKVASLSVIAVNLPANPTLYASVRLLACLDVSGTDVVDANGKSLLTSGRLDKIKSDVLMRKIPAAAFKDGSGRQGWYVATIDQPGDSC